MAEPANAVLLVHGIGSQRVGDTAAKLTEGLRRAYPGVTSQIHDGCGTVTLGPRTVRVYEVWWADLLDGEDVRGSFRLWSLHVLAWLPWLNWRAGVIPRRRLTAVLWTGVLAPLVLIVQLAYLVSAISPRVRRALDERVADVLNYVDSADRDLPKDSPLADVAERIEARVTERLERAVGDGADDVVVVAHSLGSVIAYRTLMRQLAEGADDRWRRVSTLVTIGSPLNTFSLVWPRLVAPVADAPVPPVRWHNVHDVLDPVAGDMRHVRSFAEPVHEHRVFGRAGFAFAHTSYEKQPVFLRVLSERLTGVPAVVQVSPRERLGLLLRSIGECLGVIAGAIVLVGAGALVALAAGAVLAFIFALLTVFFTIVENYGTWKESGMTFEGAVQVVFAVLMVVAFLVVPVIGGRIEARRRHFAHVHNARPDVTRVGEDTPEPPGWLVAVSALCGAALAVAFTVLLWTEGGMPAAWDAGVSVVGRIALVVGYAFFGAIGAVIGSGVGMVMHWALHTWHQWRDATRHPAGG